MGVTSRDLLGTAALAACLLGAGGMLAMGASPPPARKDLHGDPLPPGALARLGTVRFRHPTSEVIGLGFSKDGKTVVAADHSGLRVWDAATGRLVRDVRLAQAYLRGFALSPDGRLAAVATDERDPKKWSVRLVDVGTGKVERALPREGYVSSYALAFTPDGKHLVSLAGDGVVCVEEVRTGTELIRERLGRDAGRGLAVSPDGALVAVAGGSVAQKVYLWEWQTGELPRELKVAPGGVRSVSFRRDGKVLATGDDGEQGVRLWDVRTGRLLRALPPPEGGDVAAAAFSPDGKTLAVTSYHERGVSLYDPATGKRLRRFHGVNSRSGKAPVFSPDSRRLAAASDGMIRVWEVSTGKESAASATGHHQRPAIVALLSEKLALTAGDDGSARLWDATTGELRRTFEVTDHWIRGAAVSPDGRWLAASTLGQDAAVSLWDVAKGRRVYRLLGHGRLGGRRAVVFTADSKRFLTWGDDMYLRAWDVRTGKALAEHAVRPDGAAVPDLDDSAGALPWKLASYEGTFSPDGSLLVLASHKGAFAFDTKTGKQTAKLADKHGSVDALAVSPDNKLLLTSAWGRSELVRLPGGKQQVKRHPGAILVRELATGKVRHQVELKSSHAGPVAFSADGKVFAAAVLEGDNPITVYDTATGKVRGVIDKVPARPRSLAFSPDGRRLIAGLGDTTALVYDVPEKKDKK